MNLSNFLATLTTENVQATLFDVVTGKEIITLKAAGYESLDDTLEAKEVKGWSIASPTKINITIGDASGTGTN